MTDQDGRGAVECGSALGCSVADSLTTYTFTDQDFARPKFKDLLRILFAGADSDGSSTQPMSKREARCGSDLRRSLVASWSNIVSCPGATSAAQLAQMLRHADLSSSTAHLTVALGLQAVAYTSASRVTSTPFCNGLDWEDNDPIRVDCSADDVCGQIIQESPGGGPPVRFQTDGTPAAGRLPCGSAPGSRCGSDRTRGLPSSVFVPDGSALGADAEAQRRRPIRSRRTAG